MPKETIKKLKPKEKKRQDVLNELLHTERAHVRNLKVSYHPCPNSLASIIKHALFIR